MNIITIKNITLLSFLIGVMLYVIFGLFSNSVYAHGRGSQPIAEGEPEEPEDPDCEQGANSSVGRPIRLYDGRETHHVTDLVVGGTFPIVISRKYDSNSTYDSPLGYGWAFKFDRRLYEYPDNSLVRRTDCGRRDKFLFTGGAYVTPTKGARGALTANVDGTYEFKPVSNVLDRYDAEGRLIAIVRENGVHLALIYDPRGRLPLVGTSPKALDPNLPMVVARGDRLVRIEARYPDGSPIGNFVDLAYNETTGRLTSITDNLGRTVTYTHDIFGTGTRGNLESVVGPNGTSTYQYNDPLDPHNATSFQDPGEKAPTVVVYDDLGRATQQTYGEKIIDITYNPDLSVDTTTKIVDINGTTVSSKNERFEFNAEGKVTLYRDGDGVEERVTYHPTLKRPAKKETWEPGSAGLFLRKQEEVTYKTDGSTDTITISKKDRETDPLLPYHVKTFSYNSTLSFIEKESTVVEPSVCAGQNKVKTYQYDTIGNTTQIKVDGFTPDCIPVSRKVDMEFNGPLNQLSLIDGPRTDVTDTLTLEYYPDSASEGNNRARVRRVTNGVGLILRDNILYTATGKVQSELKPNGLFVTYSYYLADDRLQTITETVGGTSKTSRYSYTVSGKLQSIISADGNLESQTSLLFSYDSNDRLTRLTDEQGAYVEYVLDDRGNQLEINTYDPSQSLVRTIKQTFDTRNNVDSTTLENEQTNYTFDEHGNLLTSVDGRSSIKQYEYDALDRLASTTENVDGSDPNTTDTSVQYGYNVHGVLTDVNNPENASTSYLYDDLGNKLSKISPDSGQTIYTYDETGQQASQTDALGKRTDFTYDAISRLTSINHPSSEQDITFIYDTYPGCTNGQGKLCSMQDESGTTVYSYDGFGNLLTQTKTELGVTYVTEYTYDILGRVKTMTLPNGRIITYQRDQQGRINQVDSDINSQPTILVSNLQYEADGQLAEQTLANGFIETRTYDLAGRLQTQTVPHNSGIGDQPPVVTPPANILNLEATANPMPVTLGTASANDPEDGALLPTPDQTGPFGVGTHIITWSVTDSGGNTATATQTVTITDTTPPVLTVPANVTVTSDVPVAVTLGTATATDIFTPITIVNDAPTLFPVGITTVTWTATDANGVSATGTQNVTVEATPNQLPIANAGVDQIVAELTTVNLDASASNDPDGSIVSYQWTQTAGPIVPLNSANSATPNFTAPDVLTDTILTFSVVVTDDQGATGNDAVLITVQDVASSDTTPPVVTPPANITTEATATLTSVTLGTASANDDTDGALTPIPDQTGPFPIGSTTVTWSAIDAAGNIGTATQSVTITDTTPPVLTVPANITVTSDVPIAVTLGTATATDIFTPINITNDAPDLFPVGITTVTWTATDANGVSANGTQTVTVDASPNQLPVANAGVDQTMAELTTVNLTALASNDPDGSIVGYQWTQTAGPIVTLNNANSATPNFTAPDVLTDTVLTFSVVVTDDRGDTANDGVLITVQNVATAVDLTVSAFSSSTNILELDVSFSVNWTVLNSGTGAVGSSYAGVYISTDPIFSGDDISLTQRWTPSLASGASNSNSASPTVRTTLGLSPGSYYLIAVADKFDSIAEGNESNNTMAIAVTIAGDAPPNQSPVANAGLDQTVVELSTVNLTGAASNDPDGTITGYQWSQTSGPAVSLLNANTATPSFVAPDVTTNTVLSFSLVVTDDQAATGNDSVNITVQDSAVVDTTPPVVTPPANITTEATAGLTPVTLGTASANDDTDGPITPTANQTGPFPLGITTVTWSATDAAGNTGTATQTVTITDTTPPVLTVPANITVTSDVPLSIDIGTATATDIFTPITIVNDAPALFPVGTTTVTWTATDANGVSATGTQIVTVNSSSGQLPIDVTISAFSSSVTTIELDVSFSVSWTVLNQGTDAVGSSYAGVYISTDPIFSGDDISLTQRWTSSLASGASNSNAASPTVRTTLGLNPGSYYLIAVADKFDSIAEGNENNNTMTIAVTIAGDAPPNQLPVANAGPDQTVSEGSVVNLNGNGSNDSDGTITSYAWTQTAGPAVSLANANTATPSFSAPEVTANTLLSFNLVVTDDQGATGNDSVSITVQDSAVVDTTPPVVTPPANITTEATAGLTPVTLGSASANDDTDGPLTPTANQTGPFPLGVTTVTWSATDAAGNTGTATQTVTITDTTPPVLTVPANVTVTSDVPLAVNIGTASATDIFTPITILNDAPALFPVGTTTVTWTATDANGQNSTGTQSITVTSSPNQLPIANAGVDQTVAELTTVNLNATASNDPDGTIVGYQWTQTAGPIVTLNNANTATPNFTAPDVLTDTLLTFSVVVTDDRGDTASDGVLVTVQNVASAVDLAMSAFSSSVTSITVDVAFSVNWTVSNQGTGSVGSSYAGVYISTDPLFSGDDISLTQRWTPSLASGASNSNGASPTVRSTLGLSPGSYYLIAVADKFDSIAEGNEDNNTMAIAVTIGASASNDNFSNTRLAKTPTPQPAPSRINPSFDTRSFLQKVSNSKPESEASKPNGFGLRNDEKHGTLLTFNLNRLEQQNLPVWYQGKETQQHWVPFTHARQLLHPPQTLIVVSDYSMDVWTNEQDGLKHQYTQLSHDQKDALVKMHHVAPTLNQLAMQALKTYEYDGNGNILRITHSEKGISDYNYDALDRLTVETQAAHPPRTYDYDRNGNRTASSDVLGSDTLTYKPNSNVLDTLNGNPVVHNEIGQRTSDQNGMRTFEYNNANRLWRVYESGSLIATYTYNGLGQRTRKVTPTGTTIYHYDQAGNLVAETDATGSAQRDYIWRDNEPLAQIDVNGGVDTATLLHVDHLRTPRYGSNMTGELVWSWDSDAFGKSQPYGAVAVNLRFPGQYYDAETSLYYNWFRYYDPAMGRYITSDPIGLEGGLNTYSYVRENPLLMLDFTGLRVYKYPGGVYTDKYQGPGAQTPVWHGGYITDWVPYDPFNNNGRPPPSDGSGYCPPSWPKNDSPSADDGDGDGNSDDDSLPLTSVFGPTGNSDADLASAQCSLRELLMFGAKETAIAAAEEKWGHKWYFKLASRAGLVHQVYAQYNCAQIKLNPSAHGY